MRLVINLEGERTKEELEVALESIKLYLEDISELPLHVNRRIWKYDLRGDVAPDVVPTSIGYWWLIQE